MLLFFGGSAPFRYILAADIKSSVGACSLRFVPLTGLLRCGRRLQCFVRKARLPTATASEGVTWFTLAMLREVLARNLL